MVLFAKKEYSFVNLHNLRHLCCLLFVNIIIILVISLEINVDRISKLRSYDLGHSQNNINKRTSMKMASPGREPRLRTLTEKGREFTMEVKKRERDRTLKKMDQIGVEIQELIETEVKPELIRQSYAEWLTLYDSLYPAQEDYVALLDKSNAEIENSWFNKKCESLGQLKSTVEQWLLQSSRVGAMETKPKEMDTRSQRSYRSAAPSAVSSHLSVAILSENQKKAELLARAASLPEKRRLEEEKLKLKLQEQELEIQTELKVSDAKTKVLKELEKSLLQDTIVEEDLLQYQPPKPVTELETGNLKVKPREQKFTSGTDFQRPIYKDTSMVAVARELNKPKADISIFSGNPLDFRRFMRQFETRVNANTDSYEEKLNYLLQFTAGEPNKIVLGYSNLDAESGYKAAIEEFSDRYGDYELIAHAYVKKVLDWPTVKPDSPRALDELSIFLRECQFAVHDVNCLRVLDYSENLKLIVKKLPYYLHDKWRTIVHDLKCKGEQPTFTHLVTFIRNEAKKAIDPVYGKEVLHTPAKNNKQQKGKSTKTFVTNVTNEKTESNKEKDQISSLSFPTCLYCTGPHYLNVCENITKLSVKERYRFLKQKGLCYGCLKPGHLKTLCRNKLKCTFCNGNHPSILHVDKLVQVSEQVNHVTFNATSSATHMGASKTLRQALPIVPVKLKARTGDKYVETYALLDSGSTACFCSERVAKLLNLEGKRTTIKLLTMGQDQTHAAYELSGLEVVALDGSNALELPPVYTRPKLPVSKDDVATTDTCQKWSYLRDIPVTKIDSEVDLLIGINATKAMEPWDVVPSQNGGPFAVKTLLGWVINGPIDCISDNGRKIVSSNYIKADLTLQEQVRNYFNQDFSEKILDDVSENSLEDKRFLEIVNTSVVKNNGHYYIDLPFRSKSVFMPNNRKQAEQRLTMLAKRFERDHDLRDQYCEFMENVIEKGYAQKTPLDEQPEEGHIWYLPHHGVYHPKKKKIRIVFDCAARFQAGYFTE